MEWLLFCVCKTTKACWGGGSDLQLLLTKTAEMEGVGVGGGGGGRTVGGRAANFPFIRNSHVCVGRAPKLGSEAATGGPCCRGRGHGAASLSGKDKHSRWLWKSAPGPRALLVFTHTSPNSSCLISLMPPMPEEIRGNRRKSASGLSNGGFRATHGRGLFTSRCGRRSSFFPS